MHQQPQHHLEEETSSGLATSVIRISPNPQQQQQRQQQQQLGGPHIAWKVESPSPPSTDTSTTHGYILHQALMTSSTQEVCYYLEVLSAVLRINMVSKCITKLT